MTLRPRHLRHHRPPVVVILVVFPPVPAAPDAAPASVLAPVSASLDPWVLLSLCIFFL